MLLHHEINLSSLTFALSTADLSIPAHVFPSSAAAGSDGMLFIALYQQDVVHMSM